MYLFFLSSNDLKHGDENFENVFQEKEESLCCINSQRFAFRIIELIHGFDIVYQ